MKEKKMKTYKLGIINQVFVEPSEKTESFMMGFLVFGLLTFLPSILFQWLFNLIISSLGIFIYLFIYLFIYYFILEYLKLD